VVCGGNDTLSREGLDKWRDRSQLRGFPRCELDEAENVFYLSLGNGHFFQALNLFRASTPSVLPGTPPVWILPPGPSTLRRAVEDGVPSVVLRREMPLKDRHELSALLNSTHRRKWEVNRFGVCYAMPPNVAVKPSMFEAISKVCDADMLGQIVREKSAKQSKL
jgi:hypothetical protein